MNRREYLHASTALGLGIALAGCLDKAAPDAPASPIFIAGADGASSVDDDALQQHLQTFDVGELSPTERDDIFYMREEEKVARDVYLTLANEWGLRPHENISESEQSHMDAMLRLVELYDLEDPATGTVGTFTNPELQALHDDLVDWGLQSSLDSLKVGCRIEDKDMRDIQVRIDRTEEAAITVVYENLIRGSRNHLRAFYRTLTRRGGDYEPVFISQERFDEIVSSDFETGNGNR